MEGRKENRKEGKGLFMQWLGGPDVVRINVKKSAEGVTTDKQVLFEVLCGVVIEKGHQHRPVLRSYLVGEVCFFAFTRRAHGAGCPK
jgi:hypothetical protein